MKNEVKERENGEIKRCRDIKRKGRETRSNEKVNTI